MGKVVYRTVTGNDNNGLAVGNTSQLTAISNTGLQYIVDAIYLAVPQMAHAQEVTVRDNTNITNRIFVIEYVADETGKYQPTGNVTAIGINSLTGSNYGPVTDSPAPVILAEKNDLGLWRAAKNQKDVYVRTLTTGVHHLTNVGKNIKMPIPVAFKALGQKRVYSAQMTKVAEGYDFAVTTTEGNDVILDLGTQNAMFWEEVPLNRVGITSYPKLSEVLPADFPHKDELCID